MPFHAPNTNLPKAFSPDRAARSERPARPADYFAKILSYDLARGAIIAERVEDGQVFELTINASKVARAKERAADAARQGKASGADAGSWNGALIDRQMESKLPPESLIMVEHVVFQRKVKVGNDERFVVEGNWVHHVPDDNPEKVLRGVITGASFQNRMTQVQHWGSAMRTDTKAGEDAINALANEMDENVKNYDEKAYRPRQGVQFRAYIETDRTKEVYDRAEGKRVPRPVVQVVDGSFCYDWYREEGEGDQGEVSRPLSGDEMVQRLQAYIGYIEEKYPDQKVAIEVLPYKGYLPSKTDNSFDVNPAGFNYTARKMTSTPLRLAVGDEDFFTGRNYAVNGAIMLVKDKVERGQIVHQYMAARLFTNGYYAPLLSQIPTESGAICELHPDLQELRQPKNENAASNPGTQPAPDQGNGGFQSSLIADAGDDPFNTVGGSDPYGQAFDTPEPAAVSAPVASAPAPAAAPAPAQEEVTASDQGAADAGGNRLRRRLGGK